MDEMIVDFSKVPRAFDVLSFLWPYYFPKDRMYKNDPRLDNISMLFTIADHLVEAVGVHGSGSRLIDAVAAAGGASVAVDFLGSVVSRIPIEGFEAVMRQQPHEVIGCMVGTSAPVIVYIGIFIDFLPLYR
jgi:hypothetical protein